MQKANLVLGRWPEEQMAKEEIVHLTYGVMSHVLFQSHPSYNRLLALGDMAIS